MDQQLKLTLFALIATFFWGLSDTFFKKATKPNDKYSQFRILFVIGLFMGAQAVIELFKMYGEISFSTFPEFFSSLMPSIRNIYSNLPNMIKDIWIYIPISFLYILSMGVDFFGYRYLRISVGSPIASTSGAMAGILSWLVLKNEMTPVKFLAIMMIFTLKIGLRH